MIWFLTIVGLVPVIGMSATGNHDALFTMIGHVAIFGTALLTLIQSRKNGIKMDEAKAALAQKGDRSSP